jgi:secondary thiamine-phosphate synthase enzyme
MGQVYTKRIQIATRGHDQMLDLTPQAQAALAESGLSEGIITVFVAHSTAAVTVSECEPGLIEDVRLVAERLAPEHERYRHNALNFDDNAHSHLRALVLGPSVTVPFADRALLLGTWQRIVLIDFDTHPRQRNVVIQVLGV